MKKERERKRKKTKERKRKGKGKIERLTNITRGAPFRGTFKADAGGAPSLLCRDRAPDFVWVPQAKNASNRAN